MKSTRTWVTLGAALLCGLMAVFLAAQWLMSQSAKGVTRIVVASTDVSMGQRLTQDVVRLVEWPAASLPPGAHKDISALEGRVLRTSLLKGEAVIDAKLAPMGTTGGLSAVIGQGRRAITVRVNDVIGVAGFALPGNYVDILVNTQRDSDRNSDLDRQISKIVLERILVLAIAQDVARDETKPRVVNAVTLEVTPEQAEKLDLARSVGSLSLVLRNQMDPQAASTAGAMKSSLLDQRAALPLQKKEGAGSVSFVSTNKQYKPPLSTKTPDNNAAENRSTSEIKIAPVEIPTADTTSPVPVATPVVNHPAPLSDLFCVGVINGVRNSTECY